MLAVCMILWTWKKIDLEASEIESDDEELSIIQQIHVYYT